jgi:hypothetical protein
VYLKFLAIFISLALLACSDDKNNPTYPFERTVSDLSVVKRCPNINETCYLMMIWQHPIEKKDLQSYYVWIDTTVVKDSVQTVSQEQMDKATRVLAYKSGDGDSLNLTNLIGEFLERDSLHVAIWAKYSGESGAVMHLYIYFGDDTPPSPATFGDSASADVIYIDWVRPTDQRDFYSPGEINGPIAGYNLSIKADDPGENIKDYGNISVRLNGTSMNSYKLQRFRKNGRGIELVNENSNIGTNYLTYAIPDGKGFESLQDNNWSVRILNLNPEHSYEITIVAWDSAGNSSI